MEFTRRDFIKLTCSGALAGPHALSGRLAAQPGAPERKKIAIVSTVWRPLSRAQHIGDRFIVGYPRDGKWHRPAMDVTSIFVDQKPQDDLSSKRAEEFGIRVYPTVAGALCCGGDELAVDAVVVIGDGGDYPRNEKGQVLYPRYEFFQQVLDVFEKSGRGVPVFNESHLSHSFEKASTMVAASKRLGFPFLAGSSLPVTYRLPSSDMPLGCPIEEALMVAVGDIGAVGDAFEALQCMVERRKGGETGVKAVQLIEGDEVWKAGDEGRWSWALLEAALARSDVLYGLSSVDSRTQDLVRNGELPRVVKDPAAYLIEYTDGLRGVLLRLNGAVGDYTFAARVKGQSELESVQFLVPRTFSGALSPSRTDFACLARKIEEMIETGRAPYPVERALIAGGIFERCLDSGVQGHKRLETPELAVRYRAPAEPQFCRT